MSQIFDALRQSERDRSGAEFLRPRNSWRHVERGKTSITDHRRSGNHPSPSRRAEQLSFHDTSHKLSAESKFVCVTDTDSLAAEKFRFLAIRLRYLQQKKTIKHLLVTSSVAGEGKSTVTCKFGLFPCGQQATKVLLLEGDLRRPSLAPQLGMSGFPGLVRITGSRIGRVANIYRLDELGDLAAACRRSQREILWSFCSRLSFRYLSTGSRLDSTGLSSIRLQCCLSLIPAFGCDLQMRFSSSPGQG